MMSYLNHKNILVFLFSTVFFSVFFTAKAAVIVTPASGGLAISADKSKGSSLESFTTLGNITIASNATTDFALNQSNVTLVLSAPSNWEFNAGVGAVSFAGSTLTAASIVVTNATITITFTTNATAANNNSLIISGIQVKSTAKTPLTSINITRTSGTGSIILSTTPVPNFGTLSQTFGTFTKLQVLLPGETAAPGTATGKTGTPNTQLAGTAFNVIVSAVDENWNRTTNSPNDAISITLSDLNASNPSNSTLSSGTRTFSVTLRSIGTSSIIASDVTNGAITSGLSSNVTVNAGPFIRLLTLLPGETLDQKSATGKSGTPTIQTAGTPFNITVNAVDAAWNTIPTVTDEVRITSNDANAVLPGNASLIAGTRNYSITLRTAASRTITASDVSDPGKTANTGTVAIVPGTFTKLQVLLVGETAAPGTVTGKTGTPTAGSAGAQLRFTVNAVDAYWNKVASVTDEIKITSTDANATLPANGILSLGTKTDFRITLKTLGTQTITASNITNDIITPNTSSNVTVNAGTFYGLQVLLPGETAAPGTTTGKTGTPTAKTAGEIFPIIVNAVDIAWNIVTTATDVVKITSSDVNAVLPANESLVAGTKTFNISLRTVAPRTTITATDFTDATRRANRSAYVVVNAGNFVKLQILLPGERPSPGSSTGKTGTPSARLAGTPFSSTVNAVDAYWNRVTSVTDTIGITTSDATAVLPVNAALVAGTKTNFRVTFRTKGLQTITATNITDGSITASTSTSVMVNEGTFAKLQLLLPGETPAPGTATGKTGVPSEQTAGTPFNIIVNAVDAAWNVLSSASPDVIRITSTDVNAALPANTALSGGTLTLPVTFKTAGPRNLTALDVTNGSRSYSRSPTLTVNAGAFSKLQVLLPSERAAPGTIDGKTGNPSTPNRGTAFTVTVNAVDDNFNRITSATNLITISSSDGAATIPIPATLSSGTRNYSVNLRTTTTQTITATTASVPSTTVTCVYPIVVSNSTDFFRSVISGPWSDAASWQSSPNGTTWNPATLAPTTVANGVTVRAGDSIRVASSVSADQVIVQNGGFLIVNSGITLTLANGTGTDMEVYGTVINAGIINTTAGNLVFQNTGKYQHNYTTSSGTIPIATWNTDSECEIIGYTSEDASLIVGANQNFYNLTWNCPNQNTTSGPSLGGTFSAHNLTIISTGTGDAKLGSGTGGTITVRNYNQSGGKVTVNNTSGTTVNLNVAGDFSLTGGTLQKGAGTSTINFNGTSVQNFIKSSATLSTAVGFNINSGAKVDFGTEVLDGSAAIFTLSSGGTLITANDQGIAASGATGSIQTATRNFSTGANYIYNADNPQQAGTGLPLTVNNLTVSTPAGLTLPATSANYTINGNLDLNPGSLNMGTNNLIAGTGFTSSGSGVIYTESISATPLSSNKTWNIGIEYRGSAVQNIVPGTYSNLSFSAEGLKTGATGTINVTGNWSSADGKIDFLTNNTNVAFNGTNQSISDSDSDEGNGIIFKNLTFGGSGTKSLTTGKFSVASLGLLTMTGSSTLNANGNLFLLSDATGSGSVGPIPTGADIIGNVNVQTFITGGLDSYRSTRCISSPINDASLTRKTFQQLKDFIIVTGPGNVNNGFDLGGLKAPNAITLQTYNEPAVPGTALFIPVSTLSQSATPAKGYFIYFRGNRDFPFGKLNSPYDTPEDVTVTYTGPLNKGNISNTSLTNSQNVGDAQNGYNFVGNPYASTIDWETVLANSPTLINSVLTIKPGGGTATYHNGAINGGASRYLQAGLGFYVTVKNTESTGAINFTESSKIGTAALATPTRLLSTQQSQEILNFEGNNTTENSNSPASKYTIRMNLLDDQNSDETTIILKDGYSTTSKDDAVYFSGSTVSLGTVSSDDRNLAINFMPDINEVKEIKIWVNASESKNVKLVFSDLSELKAYSLFLKDSLLNKQIEVKSNTEYAFFIDKSNAESFGKERFKLLISRKIISLQVSGFTAKKTLSNSVELKWAAANLENIVDFEIQKSANQTDFASIKTIEIIENNSHKSYKHIDLIPLSGTNYYRIKQTGINGEILYSETKSVEFQSLTDKKITIYPNPVVDETNISLENFDSNCIVTLYDFTGRKLTQLTNETASTSIKLNLAHLPSGIYILETRDYKTKKVINTTKLIKE